jgi:hypothetical protein
MRKKPRMNGAHGVDGGRKEKVKAKKATGKAKTRQRKKR